MTAGGIDASRQALLHSGPVKKPRACLHCHVRKVRCDAWAVGVPCTRCRARNQANTCVLVGATHGRSLGRHNAHHKPRSNDTEAKQNDQTSTVEQSFNVLNSDGHHGTGAPTLNPEDDYAGGLMRSPRTFTSAGSQRNHDGAEQVHSEDIQMSVTGSGKPVREEDINVHICEDMTRGRPVVMSPASPAQAGDGREVIEYHGGINSITILGEALGQERHNRLVKVVILDDRPEIRNNPILSGLDATDMEYLSKKGALSFPPRQYCDEMLRLYFSIVYPYAPILDRIRFVEDYSRDQHSLFLMQCILANVVPHATKSLLKACGYESRLAAQKSLFSKARLLYDLGCEKSQLRRLQGSVMLSSLSFSYALDKDYRYWLSNAARIAIQMGLNRNSVSDSLDQDSRRLLRRIWWTLYNRDTLLAISGIDNLRRFDDRYCDTSILKDDDLNEVEPVPANFQHILSPLTRLQNLFMVEYSKLSLISNHFIQAFKTPGVSASIEDIQELNEQIAKWRQDLAPELQPQLFQEWSRDNILTLVLMAMAFRLEAVLCRCTKQYYRNNNDESGTQRSSQRQEQAMFELSKVIQLASMHDLVQLCPLSFMTCASTNLAMRIELALSGSSKARNRLTARTQIFADLEYLRESCEYWNSLIWTVRMLEAVIARTHLGLTTVGEDGSNTAAKESGFTSATVNQTQEARDRRHETGATDPMDTSQTSTEMTANRTLLGNTISNSQGLQTSSTFTKPCSNYESIDTLGIDPISTLPTLGDDIFGILPIMDSYDWMQETFSNFEGLDDEAFREALNSDELL